MSYKKPQMVAKSAAKKSYVAGCPTETPGYWHKQCSDTNSTCMIGKLD